VSFLRVAHRWLGLALAAVVVVVAASGGLLLFRDPYYRAVYPALGSPLSDVAVARRAEVLTAIEARWEADGIRLVKFPGAGLNAYQVWLRDGSEAFVHAETGEIIDRWHWAGRLPAFLFELHAHLLVEPSGTLTNGITAIFIVFMSLTGIVLWWPVRRGAFRLRRAVPSRLTSGELLRSHAAVGALASLPVLVFAGTGAAIVFYDEVAPVISRVMDVRPPPQPDAHVDRRNSPGRPWNAVLSTIDRTFADGQTVFYYPGTSANARLMFRKRLPGEWHPNGRTYVLLDPYTAEVVQAIDARAQGAGTRLLHAVYPVHAAKVGGVTMVVTAGFAAACLSWLAAGGAWAYLSRRAAGRRAADRAPRALESSASRTS
jgi:uncharacterized iron-regulated membrane protein